MSIDPIAIAIIVAGLFAPEAFALYLQVALCLFGATSAVSLPALGGATVTPASLFLPFFFFRAVRARGWGPMLRHVPRAAVWLGLLLIWALISALLLPRAFAGQTQIMTVDRTISELEVSLYNLHPVSGNVTQSAYLAGGFLAFLAMRALLVERWHMEWLRDAILLLAALNIVAAFLNLAEYWLGFPKLLPYLRTANYALFDAYEEAGFVRIQGTFSETSAFSAFTLPLFAFTTNCWLNGTRTTYSGVLALLSLGLLLSSTSGTAYMGLALYLICLCVILVVRSWRGGRSHSATLLAAGAFLLVAVFYVLSFAPGVVRSVSNFFEFTVLNKLQSQSGLERTSWNQQAWQNFIDTWGLGVGLGSARASSFILVLLSNVGVIGAVLFLGFVVELLRGDVEPEQAPVSSAARHAVLAALIVASVSGAVFDLGIAFYVFAAAASVRILSVPVYAQDANAADGAYQPSFLAKLS